MFCRRVTGAPQIRHTSRLLAIAILGLTAAVGAIGLSASPTVGAALAPATHAAPDGSSSPISAADLPAATPAPSISQGTTHLPASDPSSSSSRVQPSPANWLHNPDAHISGVMGAEVSSNWAGQVATGATFSAVSGDWTVPTVQPSATAQYSGTWIGIDGATNDSLIQVGTAQDSDSSGTIYSVWYEIYPAAPVTLPNTTVAPGDTIVASIAQGSPGTWTIAIGDVNRGWIVSDAYAYDGPGASAEWIEEAPTVDGSQSTLADFGTTGFTDMGLDGTGLSSGTLDPVFMADASGTIIAYPSAYDPTTDSFDITYGDPPPAVLAIGPSTGTTDGGSSVTIEGDFLGAASSVDFGAVPSSFVENDDGSITATSPPQAAGTVDITVSTPGGTSLPSAADQFTYVAPPPPPQHGYWLVGGDGGIFTFGSAQFQGSTGSMRLQRPVVGITPTADRGGYWLVASDGGIFAFGDSGFFGSIPGLGIAPAGSGAPKHLNAPIVAMVPSVDGGGYFMVAADGGVFAFGDAKFAGSCPGIGGCSGAAVAVMPDATGDGYWLVTATGHVYAFGDATNYGAPELQGVPVTSAVRTPDGGGYWILFANGAVAGYGDAVAMGGPVGTVGGSDPATSIFTTADGGGYWVASANGAVYPYGDAPNDGSMAGQHLNAPVVAATGW